MPTRRFVPIALTIGVLVGVALTYPLVLHPATTVLDDGTWDVFQFIWNLWWVREALVHLHTNPFYTRYLFYPDGTSLLFHTFSASLGLVSVPLQLVLPGGVVTAHNLLAIAAPALIVLMTALLAREVTGDPWAALAAGLIAAINAAMTWFVPILYLSSTWLVAAVLWAWWRLHRRHRWGDVVLVVVLLVGLVFASQEYAMMALALLALDSAARVLAARRLGMPPAWWPGLIVAWTVIGVVLGSIALVAVRSPAQGLPDRAVLHGSGFLAGFLRPRWLFPNDPFRFWFVLYLGTAPLLLLAATARYARNAGFWVVALVLCLLMACGPYVCLYPPLSNPAAPLPSLAHWEPGWVPGPYWLALRFVRLVRFLRAAYRWVNVAHIALGVLVAIGLAGLRARLVRPLARRAVTAVALGAIVSLGALDSRGLRAPVVPAAVPPALQWLGDDPEPAAVIELPAGLTSWIYSNFASRYMFHQTVHRKFLLEGTVARLPEGAQRLVARQFTSFAEVPWVKYVVIHHDLVEIAGPAALAQLDQLKPLLANEGELVRHDATIDIYRLKTFRPETVR